MSKKRRAFGGIFFVVSCTLAAFIMVLIVSTARSSTIKSIADNTAFVVAVRAASYSYKEGLLTYTLTGNETIPGTSYRPLSDFNNTLSQYGFVETVSEQIDMKWDSRTKTLTLQIGPFKASHGEWIMPSKQSTAVGDT